VIGKARFKSFDSQRFTRSHQKLNRIKPTANVGKLTPSQVGL